MSNDDGFKAVQAARERGLFRHGGRWWVWVRAPSGRMRRRSTGTKDLNDANRMRRMLRSIARVPNRRHLLEFVVDGRLHLIELYESYSAKTLSVLTRRLVDSDRDRNIEPLVSQWIATVATVGQLQPKTARDYERCVRALIPAGSECRVSSFETSRIVRAVRALKRNDGPKPLSSTTIRQYINTWRRFFKWLRRRAPIADGLFDDLELPKRAPSRCVFWDYATVCGVLDAVRGSEIRAALALMFGSGLELGALLSLRRNHVIGGPTRRITAPGSKNRFRENRVVFVDAWAWPYLEQMVRSKSADELLLSPSQVGFAGRRLREEFYWAQVRLGVVATPPRSTKTGKSLWSEVAGIHTLHDARHTYAMIRLLGLDGARAETMKYVAYNLGHRDEQMVMQIYSRCRGDDWIRLQDAHRQPNA